MTKTRTLTLDLPTEFADELDSLAARTNRGVSDLAAEAIAAYLDVQEWQVAAIRDAVDAADAGGRFVDHSEVVTWAESWGRDNENPRPA